MQTDEQELLAVRRLLKETTERAQQLEMERDLARRQAKELHEQLDLVSKVFVPLKDGRDFPPPSLLEAVQDVAEWVRGMSRERNERILHVFGCAACDGEHRAIWTQALKRSAAIRLENGSDLACQRAYVCPENLLAVLVSNESEETYLARHLDGTRTYHARVPTDG